jgi:hypothetical protein
VNIVSNNLSKAPEEKKNSTNEKSQMKLEDHTGNLAAKKKKKQNQSGSKCNVSTTPATVGFFRGFC